MELNIPILTTFQTDDTFEHSRFKPQVQVSTQKYVQHHIIGNCQLNPQCNITTQLLEWPQSRELTTPNIGEDVAQHELFSLLVEMQNSSVGKWIHKLGYIGQ